VPYIGVALCVKLGRRSWKKIFWIKIGIKSITQALMRICLSKT
jgi:hypothetical protein